MHESVSVMLTTHIQAKTTPVKIKDMGGSCDTDMYRDIRGFLGEDAYALKRGKGRDGEDRQWVTMSFELDEALFQYKRSKWVFCHEDGLDISFSELSVPFSLSLENHDRLHGFVPVYAFVPRDSSRLTLVASFWLKSKDMAYIDASPDNIKLIKLTAEICVRTKSTQDNFTIQVNLLGKKIIKALR